MEKPAWQPRELSTRHRVRHRDLVNVAPFQFDEKVIDLHVTAIQRTTHSAIWKNGKKAAARNTLRRLSSAKNSRVGLAVGLFHLNWSSANPIARKNASQRGSL